VFREKTHFVFYEFDATGTRFRSENERRSDPCQALSFVFLFLFRRCRRLFVVRFLCLPKQFVKEDNKEDRSAFLLLRCVI
jgi:hypothetical protein